MAKDKAYGGSSNDQPFYNPDSTINPNRSGNKKDPNPHYYNPKQKYRTTKGMSDKGVKDLFAQFGNFLNDSMRNVGNFGSSVTHYLSGQDAPVTGGGYGDYLVGSAPAMPTTSRTGITGVPDRIDKGTGAPSQDPATQDAYDAMMAFLSGQGAKNDARLEAMYRQAADYIANQQGATKGIYDTAAQGYTNAQQQASNAVNMGADVARQQQSKAMQALGIEEAANNILARGEDLSGTQMAAQNRFADYLNANLNRNTGAQTSALQGLLNLSQATMGEGARARAAYGERTQGQLLDLLRQQQESQINQQVAAAKLANDQATAQLRWGKPAPTTVDDVANATATLLAQAQAANIPADQQQAWVEMQLKQIGQ